MAVKLIVLAIPPLTVAGFLWVAREVHGRIPPTAFFAVPFAYGHPFLFGFVNYALGDGTCLSRFCAVAPAWTPWPDRLRAFLFVPISLIIFFSHTYGWGALGLMCFSAEAVRQHDSGRGWLKAAISAAAHSSVMALPIVIMLAWRSETHGGSTSVGSTGTPNYLALCGVARPVAGCRRRLCRGRAGPAPLGADKPKPDSFSRNLAFSEIVLAAAFSILPWTVFGSAYADMRLAPYMIAVLLLAIRFRGRMNNRFASALAAAGLLFSA